MTEKEFSGRGRQRTGIILFISLGFPPPKHTGRKIDLLKTGDDLAERNRCKNIKKINNNIGAKTRFRQNRKFCQGLNLVILKHGITEAC